MRAEAVSEIQEEQAVVSDDARDMLEIYCYLACMGPGAFERDKAMELVTAHSGPDRALMVGTLLDPGRRGFRSRELGQLLAENLSNRVKDTGNVISALLPALVSADTDNGFTVLKNLAAASSHSVAEAFSEVLLSLTVADSAAIHSNRPAFIEGDDERPRAMGRLRYLVSVITSLNLEAQSRTRLFLALSQTLEDGELIRDIVLTSIFPSDSTESTSVFLEGNDQALKAVLNGAAERPNGKAEFYGACRAVMEMGFDRGLPALARVYRLLNGPQSGLRAMSSMVRAAVLLFLESSCNQVKDVSTLLAKEYDLDSLDLLTVVAPGIKEPHRSALCDYLILGSNHILRMGKVTADDYAIFSQVVIGACVLHKNPERAGSQVRKMFLDAAGSLHVKLRASPSVGTDEADASFGSVHSFRRIVETVSAEFRRRDSLSTCLTNVMPLLSDFGHPPRPEVMGQPEAFVD